MPGAAAEGRDTQATARCGLLRLATGSQRGLWRGVTRSSKACAPLPGTFPSLCRPQGSSPSIVQPDSWAPRPHTRGN